MGKKYADFMDEISADDLYKGLLAFGLFSNKIPPVFSSTSFLITVLIIIRHSPIEKKRLGSAVAEKTE